MRSDRELPQSLFNQLRAAVYFLYTFVSRLLGAPFRHGSASKPPFFRQIEPENRKVAREGLTSLSDRGHQYGKEADTDILESFAPKH
jgi:hypothetical protein